VRECTRRSFAVRLEKTVHEIPDLVCAAEL
jgi:hypothetical protein